MEFQLPVNANPEKQKRLNKLEIVTKKTKNGNHITINLDEDIGEPSEYRGIVTKLREASDKDIVELHISSWGGYLDSAVLLVNELVLTKAKTIAVIHTAASAATLVAFACDQIETLPTSAVMLHNFSVQQSGKGQEVRAKAEFDEKQFSKICDLLYVGILTEDEIKAMQEDKDIWLLGCELKERMERLQWSPVRKRGSYACI